MEIIVLVAVLGGIFLITWGVIAFIKALFGSSPHPHTAPRSDASDDLDGMNEGYYHDGPEGYSPMTSYPDSYYGRSGNDDSEDEEHH